MAAAPFPSNGTDAEKRAWADAQTAPGSKNPGSAYTKEELGAKGSTATPGTADVTGNIKRVRTAQQMADDEARKALGLPPKP